MKFVKKAISLPEDLHKYAKDRAKRLSRENGRPANVSGLIADLLNTEKKREELAKAA